MIVHPLPPPAPLKWAWTIRALWNNKRKQSFQFVFISCRMIMKIFEKLMKNIKQWHCVNSRYPMSFSLDASFISNGLTQQYWKLLCEIGYLNLKKDFITILFYESSLSFKRINNKRKLYVCISTNFKNDIYLKESGIRIEN